MTREEAINKVRQMSLPKETMEILQALAPELKESEDERIREQIEQAIIEHDWSVTYKVSKEDCLAYLEKQKEQDVKVISWRDPDDCADIPEGHFVVIAYQYGVFGLGYVAGGKVICPDREQKPSAILYIPNSDEQVIIEQKEKQKENSLRSLEIPAENVAPAEGEGPFEEDEFLEGELSAFLQNYDKEYDDDAAVSDVAKHFYELGKKVKQKPVEIHIDNPNIQKFDADVKITTSDSSADGKELLYVSNKSYNIGFRDGVASVKPAEWSEEDEERLDSIIESYKVLLKDYKACHDVDYIPYNSNTVIRNVVDDINFLKSLRTDSYKNCNSRWAPSEEQMEALMDAIEGNCPAPTSYMSRRLEDLYEGLANTFGVEAKLDK